jgi:hypothetical protein
VAYVCPRVLHPHPQDVLEDPPDLDQPRELVSQLGK